MDSLHIGPVMQNAFPYDVVCKLKIDKLIYMDGSYLHKIFKEFLAGNQMLRWKGLIVDLLSRMARGSLA